MPPSGNDTEASQAYYRWLFEQYLKRIPDQTWHFNWTGPWYIYIWAFVLIAFFGIFAWFFFGPIRKRGSRYSGELYAPVSFNGYIYERVGRISWFSWLVWSAIVGYALSFFILHLLNGQVY